MSIDPDYSTTTEDTSTGNTVTFKRSHFYIALVPVMFVCGLAVGYLFWGPTNNDSVLESDTRVADKVETTEAEVGVGEVQRFDIGSIDDPCIGPENAPITIIEFSDFQCAYCARFVDSTLVPLLETYPDEIRFCYRDFPLDNIHPEARSAAEAAQCAFEQDRFWEFHNGIFRNQTTLSDDLYIELASNINLDVDQFEKCYSSGRFRGRVNEDFSVARDLGVTGTPTFFVNGRPLVGAQPLEAFMAVIESELRTQ